MYIVHCTAGVIYTYIQQTATTTFAINIVYDMIPLYLICMKTTFTQNLLIERRYGLMKTTFTQNLLIEGRYGLMKTTFTQNLLIERRYGLMKTTFTQNLLIERRYGLMKTI